MKGTTHMSFDLGKIAPETLTDVGVQMTLRDVRSGDTITQDGVPVTITLLGSDSDEVMRIRRAQINKRLETMTRSGKAPTISIEEQEADSTERLVAATTDWSFTELDGKPFGFSPDNARTLYTSKRFSFIRAQAIEFMEEVSNFFKK